MEPNQQDYTQVNNSQTLIPMWRGRTLKAFIKALKRYLELLLPHARPNNTAILKELRLIKMLIQHIVKYSREAQDDLDVVQLPLEAANYKLLSDVVHKYWAIKNSELKRKKDQVLIEGALEGEEKEIEELRETLQTPLFQTITRRKTLVPDFSIPNVVNQSQNKQEQKVQQQISVGNVYGQVVFGDNLGNLYQTNNAELLSSLQELFKLVSEAKDLSPEIKGNAIGDIQTIQAQVMKSKPDKSIIEKAKDSLSVLADATQIATSFAPLAIPYISKISELISKLNF